jgi:hypothetical protein
VHIVRSTWTHGEGTGGASGGWGSHFMTHGAEPHPSHVESGDGEANTTFSDHLLLR